MAQVQMGISQDYGPPSDLTPSDGAQNGVQVGLVYTTDGYLHLMK